MIIYACINNGNIMLSALSVAHQPSFDVFTSPTHVHLMILGILSLFFWNARTKWTLQSRFVKIIKYHYNHKQNTQTYLELHSFIQPTRIKLHPPQFLHGQESLLWCRRLASQALDHLQRSPLRKVNNSTIVWLLIDTTIWILKGVCMYMCIYL